MNQSADSSRYHDDLLALLQGELDDDGMARLQQHLASSPEAARDAGQAIAQWLALRSSVRQSMRANCPPVPAALRDSIMQMMAGESSAVAASASSSSAAGLSLPRQAQSSSPPQTQAEPSAGGFRLFHVTAAWAAAALVVLTAGLGLWTGHLTYQNDPTSQPLIQGRLVAAADGSRTMRSSNQSPSSRQDLQLVANHSSPPVAYAQLSDDRINAFGKRHNTCSKRLERLYKSSEFPREVGQMPQAIAGCLGKKPRGSLDLSRAGYQFTQAGECRVPGQTSVHLVYKAKSADDSVSLWVVNNTGQPQIEENILYQGDPADSVHPIFFWREGDLVYYLVGNAFAHTRKAATDLLVASR